MWRRPVARNYSALVLGDLVQWGEKIAFPQVKSAENGTSIKCKALDGLSHSSTTHIPKVYYSCGQT
jgi:hypothetical protein